MLKVLDNRNYSVYIKMSKIVEGFLVNQMYISESVVFFKEGLKKIYNLEDYSDPTAPCLFVGQYRPEDKKVLQNHKGPSIALWAGIDAKHPHNIADYNIVTNPQQEIYFKPAGIPYEYIPFCWTPDVLTKQPIYCGGKHIYCYCPNEVYGRSIAEKLAQDYPIILSFDKNQYTKEELETIYSDTFLNLRLRNISDGGATTVQECGLRGIPSVWNGDMPHCAEWKNIGDIIRAIKHSMKFPREQEHSRSVQDAFKTFLQDSINLTFNLFNSIGK